MGQHTQIHLSTVTSHKPVPMHGRAQKGASTSLSALGLALALSAWANVAVADTIKSKPPATLDRKPYSKPTSHDVPQRVFWGDTHLHTDNSFDAGLMGTRLGPEDAFRFARGEEVVSTSGVPAKLRRSYDFLVVSDHCDYMGLPLALRDGAPEILADQAAKHWYDLFHSHDEGGFKLFSEW